MKKPETRTGGGILLGRKRVQSCPAKAFTLAEVLITLVVIGVVAALTTTVIMPNVQQRVNSQRQANIVYKITQATNNMKSLGFLNKYASTDDFVDELVKHIKISKRCGADNIAECWPTKTVITSEGEEFEVSQTKTGKQLGFKDRASDNVGLVLADGSSIIMTYDTDSEGLEIGDVLTASAISLPVGGGYEEFLEYTTNTTGALAFVMDVNGAKGPNSETIGTKYNDIRNLNGAHFSTGCAGVKVGGKCYYKLASYTPISCTSQARAEGNDKYCGSNPSRNSKDYYAGAMKACIDMDLKLADVSTLVAIANNPSLRSAIGNISGWHWSSTDTGVASYYYAKGVVMPAGTTFQDYKIYNSYKGLCVGD